MDGIIVRVDSSVLENKASEFESCRAQIMDLIDQMKSEVRSLDSVWEGETSQMFQRKFAALDDDIEYLNSIIIEHVTDLNEIAATYAAGQNEVESAMQALPKDIIK